MRLIAQAPLYLWVSRGATAIAICTIGVIISLIVGLMVAGMVWWDGFKEVWE